ncbi:hypothetical protein CPTAKMNP4_134 [Salmonella phage vB_SenM-AKM_NP4]|uniref:Uncharacterized protein n=2 Tax=Gelderlandvirus TaxID=1913653 RepID=M1HNV0_BPS16|nr:hypothetical protein I133_gp138 [Salmonella phage vB_SenM-S16]YP_009126335.1 hypothetical protein STP4a_128 [Salmonella phage STP4-a]WDR21795.1 hypothetical protein PJM34_0127 [Salmonella phage vB_SenM_UTK0003]WLI71756.1 hypothetical protein CPTAKMNP4_134 [Salmonella phage vB_SenM-AKM_NP4]AGE48187.1 hypothetical protein [Salmonella phage vB_SenM-S16]AHJ86982.1 hypothetical protein STP4a_128 [Salmonella phage STP4-a]
MKSFKEFVNESTYLNEGLDKRFTISEIKKLKNHYSSVKSMLSKIEQYEEYTKISARRKEAEELYDTILNIAKDDGAI